MFSALLTVLVLLLPPCHTEGSANCHWDASAQGNGVGHSFVNLAGSVFWTD